MPWSEISPGHFQRSLGDNETYIKIIGDAGHSVGHEHWSINADATYATKVPTEDFLKRLGDAWKVLRFQHPSIAAVASEAHVDYQVPDDAALQKWVKQTFVIEKTNTLDEIVAGQAPSPYVVLYVFPESKQILMHTSHWRCDGVGFLLLMNAFVALVGSETLPAVKWGEEVKYLAPTIEDALKLPTEPREEVVAEVEKWTRTFDGYTGAVGIDCAANKTARPKGTKVVRVELSKTSTSAILVACKAHKISVTTAVHAALAEANWAFAPADAKDKHYTSTIRATLRTFLPKPFWPAYAAGLYTSGYMHSLPAGRSFAENAKELNDLYRNGLSKELVEGTRQYAVKLQEVFQNTPPDAGPNDVDVSSVGVMDKLVAPIHGSFELTSVGVGVEMLSRQMMCFAWTFRGKLTLSLVYNESFYAADIPTQFLEKLIEILVKELGAQAWQRRRRRLEKDRLASRL